MGVEMKVVPNLIKYCVGSFDYPGMNLLIEPKFYLPGGPRGVTSRQLVTYGDPKLFFSRSVVHANPIPGAGKYIRDINSGAPLFMMEKINAIETREGDIAVNFIFQINTMFIDPKDNRPICKYRADIASGSKLGIISIDLSMEGLKTFITPAFPDGIIPLFQGHGQVIRYYPGSKCPPGPNYIKVVDHSPGLEAVQGEDLIY